MLSEYYLTSLLGYLISISNLVDLPTRPALPRVFLTFAHGNSIFPVAQAKNLETTLDSLSHTPHLTQQEMLKLYCQSILEPNKTSTMTMCNTEVVAILWSQNWAWPNDFIIITKLEYSRAAARLKECLDTFWMKFPPLKNAWWHLVAIFK